MYDTPQPTSLVAVLCSGMQGTRLKVYWIGGSGCLVLERNVTT